MMRRLGVDVPAELESVRYRGNGWPGMARVTPKAGDAHEESYAASWGELQKHRQWRCYVCPDHTGEFADIAVGDPWYREISADEPGQSLILARTEKGREYLRRAVEAGYLEVKARDAATVVTSQPNLLKTRGAVWTPVS